MTKEFWGPFGQTRNTEIKQSYCLENGNTGHDYCTPSENTVQSIHQCGSSGLLLKSLLDGEGETLHTGSSGTLTCRHIRRQQSSSPVWPVHSSWQPSGTARGRHCPRSWSSALACLLGSSLRRSACPRTPSALPSSDTLSSHLLGRRTVSLHRL